MGYNEEAFIKILKSFSKIKRHMIKWHMLVIHMVMDMLVKE